MKNASGFICAILLAVTTSTALPSDKPEKKVVKKAADPKAAPAATVEPAKQKIVTPVFHWFGPLEQKKGQQDKC
jgi:hypothetical protein